MVMKSLLNKAIYFSFERHLKTIFWRESAFGFAVSVENYSNLISIMYSAIREMYLQIPVMNLGFCQNHCPVT